MCEPAGSLRADSVDSHLHQLLRYLAAHGRSCHFPFSRPYSNLRQETLEAGGSHLLPTFASLRGVNTDTDVMEASADTCVQQQRGKTFKMW